MLANANSFDFPTDKSRNYLSRCLTRINKRLNMANSPHYYCQKRVERILVHEIRANKIDRRFSSIVKIKLQFIVRSIFRIRRGQNEIFPKRNSCETNGSSRSRIPDLLSFLLFFSSLFISGQGSTDPVPLPHGSFARRFVPFRHISHSRTVHEFPD